jgi:hypothetical protein
MNSTSWSELEFHFGDDLYKNIYIEKDIMDLNKENSEK